MNKRISRNKIKFLAIICFISISLSVFIAYINPIKGYELSIYQSTNYLVWMFLIISILGGVTLIVHQVYTKAYENNNFWLFGFLILILSRMSLIYIPFIRGYYAEIGDHFTHIGFIKDILFTGHFANDNFYPIIHILLAEITSIMDVSVELVANYSTALLSIFYVISIYLLATYTLPEKSAQILSVAAVGGVLFDRYDFALVPIGWSIRYLPLVLFFFFKSSKSVEYKLFLVIAIIVYPLFHVLSGIILVIILLAIGFGRAFFLLIERKKLSLNNVLNCFPLTQVIIVLGVLLPWILSFRFFDYYIRGLYWSLRIGGGLITIDWMYSQLDKVGIHGLDFVKLLITDMGDNIIFLILSFVAAVILFKKYQNKKDLKKYHKLIILMSITLIIGCLYGSYLFNLIPGLHNIRSHRLLRYLIMLTPIFVGFSFQEFISRKRTPIIASLLIIIIMIASSISMFNLFSSPYTIQPNNMVIYMDVAGYQWLFTHKTENIDSTGIMTHPRRFADAILGTKGAREYRSPQIPDHFNYLYYSTLGESYQEDRYAVLTKRCKLVYDTVWREIGRFDKEDFDKLYNDKTVDKIYVNDEFELWYVHSMHEHEK